MLEQDLRAEAEMRLLVGLVAGVVISMLWSLTQKNGWRGAAALLGVSVGLGTCLYGWTLWQAGPTLPRAHGEPATRYEQPFRPPAESQPAHPFPPHLLPPPFPEGAHPIHAPALWHFPPAAGMLFLGE
jgi:hypothetical protein